MKRRVADIIFETLADNGVTHAFCVVGGGAMYLDNALGISTRIKTLFHHHEQACSMACEGYARVNEIPAICCVTSGPGGTNALTGVMGAYQDSIPMIVISGQVRYATTVAESGLNLRRRGEQEFNIVDTVKTMTKYAKMIIDPCDIKMEVQKAFDIAMHGRRGPVWLDIPLDVQSAMVEEDELTPVLPAPEMIRCTDEDIEAIITALKEAKAPCILAGSAIGSSFLQRKLEAVLEQIRVPVVSAAVACDILYHEHPLYFGSTGGVGTRSGNFVMQNSDVLLVLGCSLGFKQTSFVQEAFAPDAKVIMVDVNPDEAKKRGLRLDAFIHCDVEYILDKLVAEKTSFSAPQAWIDHCLGLKHRFDLYEGAVGQPDDRVNSYNFWKEYVMQEPDDSITVLGNSSCVTPRLQFENQKQGQKTFTNINCGSMGCGLPSSMGAVVAAGRPVVVIDGDGSFMMNLQELQTIKHNNLPVKLVLFANDGYRGITQTCKNYFKGFNVGCTPESGLSMPNFATVISAFGIPNRECHTNGELKENVAWLLAQPSYCVLVIHQMYDNPVAPVIKSRLNEDGSSCPVVLHDMFPFLDKEELQSCMYHKG